jgi:hypothetical protein
MSLLTLFRRTQRGAVDQSLATTKQSSSTNQPQTSPTSQSAADMEQWRLVLANLLTEIVGEKGIEPNFVLRVEPVGPTQARFILETSDPAIEIAWTYVQDIWLKMCQELENGVEEA